MIVVDSLWGEGEREGKLLCNFLNMGYSKSTWGFSASLPHFSHIIILEIVGRNISTVLPAFVFCPVTTVYSKSFFIQTDFNFLGFFPILRPLPSAVTLGSPWCFSGLFGYCLAAGLSPTHFQLKADLKAETFNFSFRPTHFWPLTPLSGEDLRGVQSQVALAIVLSLWAVNTFIWPLETKWPYSGDWRQGCCCFLVNPGPSVEIKDGWLDWHWFLPLKYVWMCKWIYPTAFLSCQFGGTSRKAGKWGKNQ